MSWAANRGTTRVEDEAYCLLGLFGISMPTLYGEGRKAFYRLQEEILRTSEDTSLFAWGDKWWIRAAADMEKVVDVIVQRGREPITDHRSLHLLSQSPSLFQPRNERIVFTGTLTAHNQTAGTVSSHLVRLN